MKIKHGFIMRKVGKQYVVAATGEASKHFNGMIRLNSSAAFTFNLLKDEITEDEMVSALMKEYSVDEIRARADIKRFLETLKEAGVLA